MSSEPKRHLSTRVIHGGLSPEPGTGAILTPIYQSTTFVQEAVGKDKGFTYSRTSNPTVSALERNLGEFEQSLPAACFSTGMSAIMVLFLATMKAGDHVVVSDVVYGGTVRLLRQVLADFGVRTTLVDTARLELLEAAITPETRLVLIESPANPTLKLTDIAGAARIAHARGALLAVDNTLLPGLQDPFALGADVIVYSTTKYIEGHNCTVGGALLTRDQALADKIRFLQNAVGVIQAPFESWLTLRGIKTLPLRMRQHSEGALTVAQFLENHPRVRNVAYPFLESFPQVELARRQQKSGGGMIAFEVEGGTEAGIRVMSSVRLCSLAESLGAVETLVTHPASMTHAVIPPEERQAIGIGDGLIRLSVGLEDPADIIADLDQALSLSS
jgi:cystathionine beta-lyase/cystathionine gamma-synthase